MKNTTCTDNQWTTTGYTALSVVLDRNRRQVQTITLQGYDVRTTKANRCSHCTSQNYSSTRESFYASIVWLPVCLFVCLSVCLSVCHSKEFATVKLSTPVKYFKLLKLPSFFHRFYATVLTVYLFFSCLLMYSSAHFSVSPSNLSPYQFIWSVHPAPVYLLMVCLLVCLFVCLLACLSLDLPVWCLSVRPSVCLCLFFKTSRRLPKGLIS